MKTPREIEFQEWIKQKLYLLELYPFNIFFTFGRRNTSILGITFIAGFDLRELLDIVDYYSLCDKSGFIILYDSNTLICSGNALLLLIDKLNEK